MVDSVALEEEVGRSITPDTCSGLLRLPRLYIRHSSQPRESWNLRAQLHSLLLLERQRPVPDPRCINTSWILYDHATESARSIRQIKTNT